MSTAIKEFSPTVSFAGKPDRSDLEEWARAGYRTVVNLRPAGEVERGLSPVEEQNICKELSLQYHHLPTTLDGLTAGYIRSCKAALSDAPTPMLVHCAGGARAAALAAVLHAWSQGSSGEEVVGMVENTGQSFNQNLRGRVLDLAENTER